MTCTWTWSALSESGGRARRLLVALAVLAAAAAAAPSAAPAQEGGFKLDHFLCYGVSNQDFEARTVFVDDQFGPSTVRAFRRAALCNPVSKDGGEVRNPRAHLVCYAIERREPFDPVRVRIFNQFDQGLPLEAGRPVLLCLPSGKEERPQGHVPIPEGLDHFQCYRARSPKDVPQRHVRLKDQFGEREGVTSRPGLLCNPAKKTHPNGEGSEIVNPDDHLVCYGLKTKPPFKPRGVVISNQFETDIAVKVHRVRPLCLPSHKRKIEEPEPEPEPEQPDLRPIIHDLEVTGCPGGQGTCETVIRYEVFNLGPGASGPFDVLASADPGLATQKTVGLGGLAPGASTGPLSVTLGPADNCYDPNCRVAIDVDPLDAIAETDETNNSATREEMG